MISKEDEDKVGTASLDVHNDDDDDGAIEPPAVGEAGPAVAVAVAAAAV